MNQMQAKVALITGGASGIGAATARTFAREGAKVVITDLNERLGQEAVASIRAEGGDVVFLQQDVTDEKRWAEVVAETEQHYGKLNVLVANAGIGPGASSIVDVTLAEWRQLTAINLDGVFLSVKYCLPAMRRAQEGGAIVMLSSIVGIRGSSYLAAYSATKGGVRTFAKSVALECAQMGDGIRCNSVHPGIIDTPIWSSSGQPQDPQALAKATVPLGFAGSAQDIANGILYLASDASRFVTGIELVIEGGALIGGGIRPK